MDPSLLGQGSMLVAGGIGGAAFWVTVFPLDVVKSRIQTDNVHAPQYRGTLHCLRTVRYTLA